MPISSYFCLSKATLPKSSTASSPTNDLSRFDQYDLQKRLLAE